MIKKHSFIYAVIKMSCNEVTFSISPAQQLKKKNLPTDLFKQKVT